MLTHRVLIFWSYTPKGVRLSESRIGKGMIIDLLQSSIFELAWPVPFSSFSLKWHVPVDAGSPLTASLMR
jgi:hypothetical protein